MARELLKLAADLGDFARIKEAGERPLLPRVIENVYIHLDFEHKYENATNADDARKFLRSVARAAKAANDLATEYGGVLLEVQGSILHVGLLVPKGSEENTWGKTSLAYVADLHRIYNAVFDNRSMRVQGWRMTIDVGNTLVVQGRGVHGDDSLVSLGTSANRPAKHLHRQLGIKREEDRDLKRYYVGVYDRRNDGWLHFELGTLSTRLHEKASSAIAFQAREGEPTLHIVEAIGDSKTALAQAAPIAPAGGSGSPTPDRPKTYYGWVMRADLDGFTQRVEKCFDNNSELTELAYEFHRIMDAACEFTDRHKETLAQLPWAGDNYTAAAVFTTNDDYETAVPIRLVELALDYVKVMRAEAGETSFGDWAHGIAGGVVHGNAKGNVYIAGVEVGYRRFLIGVGEGFGRSTQAFADIEPDANEIVVYEPDWDRLDEEYKCEFEKATNRHGQTSALYRISHQDDLCRVRGKKATRTKSIPVNSPSSRRRQITIKPHYR